MWLAWCCKCSLTALRILSLDTSSSQGCGENSEVAGAHCRARARVSPHFYCTAGDGQNKSWEPGCWGKFDDNTEFFLTSSFHSALRILSLYIHQPNWNRIISFLNTSSLKTEERVLSMLDLTAGEGEGTVVCPHQGGVVSVQLVMARQSLWARISGERLMIT